MKLEQNEEQLPGVENDEHELTIRTNQSQRNIIDSFTTHEEERAEFGVGNPLF